MDLLQISSSPSELLADIRIDQLAAPSFFTITLSAPLPAKASVIELCKAT